MTLLGIIPPQTLPSVSSGMLEPDPQYYSGAFHYLSANKVPDPTESDGAPTNRNVTGTVPSRSSATFMQRWVIYHQSQTLSCTFDSLISCLIYALTSVLLTACYNLGHVT